MLAVLHDALEQLHQLVPGDGVEPACGLVKDEQLRPVRQREGKGELDLHARGELAHTLVFVQVKTAAELPVDGAIPVRVETPRHRSNVRKARAGIIVCAAEGNADALLAGELFLPKVHSVDPNLARVRADKAQHRLERGGLARAVSADEAHNVARFQRKGRVLQRKAFVPLAEASDREQRHRKPSLIEHIVYTQYNTPALRCQGAWRLAPSKARPHH